MLRRRLIAVLVSLVATGHALGASSYDTAVAAHVTTSPNTQNITVANNLNRVIVVHVETSAGETVTSVTATGVTTWQGSAAVGATAGNVARGEIWCGLAPSTGTVSVSVSVTGLTGFLFVQAVSVYNADQTTPCVNYTGNAPGSNPAAVTVTSVSGDVVTASDEDGGGAAVTIAGCTTTIDASSITGGGVEGSTAHCIASSTSTAFSAWGSNGKVVQGVDVATAAGGAAAPPTLTLLGVGR